MKCLILMKHAWQNSSLGLILEEETETPVHTVPRVDVKLGTDISADFPMPVFY